MGEQLERISLSPQAVGSGYVETLLQLPGVAVGVFIALGEASWLATAAVVAIALLSSFVVGFIDAWAGDWLARHPHLRRGIAAAAVISAVLTAHNLGVILLERSPLGPPPMRQHPLPR